MHHGALYKRSLFYGYSAVSAGFSQFVVRASPYSIHGVCILLRHPSRSCMTKKSQIPRRVFLGHHRPYRGRVVLVLTFLHFLSFFSFMYFFLGRDTSCSHTPNSPSGICSQSRIKYTDSPQTKAKQANSHVWHQKHAAMPHGLLQCRRVHCVASTLSPAARRMSYPRRRNDYLCPFCASLGLVGLFDTYIPSFLVSISTSAPAQGGVATHRS